MLALLHPGFDDVTEIDIDQKGRFLSFKVTPPSDRVLCVYAPSGDSSRNYLARRRLFEGLQNYMENCNADKMERDGRNKIQTL